MNYLIIFLIKYLMFSNFGVVERGKVYRSSQRWLGYLFWPFLGLKTVINLSHKPEKDSQDKFEEWLCKKMGIGYIEFPTIGPGENFDEAYASLLKAERPVLVHCEGGVDRTGGVIGCYKKEVLGVSLTEIVYDWQIYGTPAESWLRMMWDRWGQGSGL